MDYGVLSVLIPLLTIVIALASKDVIVSLLGGIFGGLLVTHHYRIGEALTATADGFVALLGEGWIAKTLLFSLFVGAIIALLERSGAVASFVAYIESKARRLDSVRGAQLIAYITGLVIFIESSITSLVAGTLARPLCDRNGVSREKLAYICDSTSAPVCSLIPMNAWGALLLGLIVAAIDKHVIAGNGVQLLVASIPYNFYAWITLVLVLVVIYKRWDLGPMRRACIDACTKPVQGDETVPLHRDAPAALWPMLVPVTTLVLAVPVGLYLTGKGDIFQGSGSTSVYMATIVTLGVMYGIFVWIARRLTHRAFMEGLFAGMGEMLPVATVLLLALFIGKVIGELGTAHYLAQLLGGHIAPQWIPMLVFLTASATSFSTGTSWGTFSIMMPIALALGAPMGVNVPLLIAAVISGGIFGDHASPISDTTIISSMAAGCDPVAHVRTQLPYALIAGALAAFAFCVAGWLTV